MSKDHRYIAWSPEGGWCGHRHTTKAAAQKCAAKHETRMVHKVDAARAKRDGRRPDRVMFNGGSLYYKL